MKSQSSLLIAGHKYDGFVAFGILFHVRLKHFTNDWGRTTYHDNQKQTGLLFIYMKYINNTLDAPKEFVDHFMDCCRIADENVKIMNKIDFRYWCKYLPIYTNYVMAANSNKIICMQVENAKLVIAYLMMTGQKYNTNNR